MIRPPVLVRAVAALVAALVLAGCADDTPPRVTFATGAAEVVARPAQYCTKPDLSDCVGDPAALVSIAVPPGTALRITVPSEIAQTPWQVVFTYRDAAGAQTDGRSSVFTAKQDEYGLELPAPTDRLLSAQVQQYGAAPQIDPGSGEVEFPIRASWVLTAAV